jgi:GNAT superfamily N-acetyltransferase
MNQDMTGEISEHRVADGPTISIEALDDDFRSWKALLEVLYQAFEYQRERIDPPSSLYRLDEELLAKKAGEERVFVATDRGSLVGCVFARDTGTSIYLGKLAVLPPLQGRGIGRRLVQAVEEFAGKSGRGIVELETRIELAENREKFESYGFRKVGENAHPGYDRPTSISMEKRLAPDFSRASQLERAGDNR